MDRSRQKHVFLTSLLLTLAIFCVGIILSYLLDFVRINEITKVIDSHELDTEAYFIQQDFVGQFGGNECNDIEERLAVLKQEVRKVGIDLSNYGSKSFFKKNDYDYLKRKYFLLELELLDMVNNVNDQCGHTYVPVVFFFKIDDNPSERQGFVLDDINDAYRSQVAILAIDKDYQDEPLVKMLVSRYNVSTAPTMIIDNSQKVGRLMYTGELNATILKILRRPDEYGQFLDFNFVLNQTGTNKSRLIGQYKTLLDKGIDEYAKADVMFALGRLTKNDSLMCSALSHYDSFVPENSEEKALLFETFAAIGCGRNRNAFLVEAAKLWDSLGVSWRANICRKLSQRSKVNLVFANYTFENKSRTGFSSVVIGKSEVTLGREDIVVSQVDRVNRDWLSGQLNYSPFSKNLLTVFSEKYSLPPSELLPEIGWHEGARLKEIQKTGLVRQLAVGTMVARNGNQWYAPNESGVFMFEVPIDKVLYPTTRFLSKDIAVIFDTHGVNMVVEQAMRFNASAVVACCDNIGKVKAAKYLADKGKKVICFTDKYVPDILFYNLSILGSPPLRRNGNQAVLGGQPISISRDDVIVVEDVANYSGVQSYYDTPARYFHRLALPAIYFNLTHSNPHEFVDFAIRQNASVLGARVYSYQDYSAIKSWLDADKSHRVVLFHSASYPYGMRMLLEYPLQSTFDDINPVVK